MENTWAKVLNEGKEVNVIIDVVYEGVLQRYSKFILEYDIDGKEYEKMLKNVAGGK